MHLYSYRFNEIQDILNTLPLPAERIYANLSLLKCCYTYKTEPLTKRDIATHSHLSKSIVYRMLPILMSRSLIVQTKIGKKFTYYLKYEHMLKCEIEQEYSAITVAKENGHPQHNGNGNGTLQKSIDQTNELLNEMKG